MVPFQGSDSREFWQRAEDRNANTANLYAQLGINQVRRYGSVRTLAFLTQKSEFTNSKGGPPV